MEDEQAARSEYRIRIAVKYGEGTADMLNIFGILLLLAALICGGVIIANASDPSAALARAVGIAVMVSGVLWYLICAGLAKGLRQLIAIRQALSRD